MIIALGCNKKDAENIPALNNILKNLVQGTITLSERQQRIDNAAQGVKYTRHDDSYHDR